MQKLLNIEWLKLKNYRTFWILIGLYLILMPLWSYMVANGSAKFSTNGMSLFSKSFAFPDVWDNIGYMASYFITFLSILVIIITTNEYNFKTNRQNLIDGWKRTDVLHAKVLLVVVLSLVATIHMFVVCGAFGIANSGSVSDMFGHLDKPLHFFLLSLNYMGFALLIGTWIRRGGLAISLFLLYDIIIETLLKFGINWKSDGHLGNFLPLQSSDELFPLPLLKMAAPMMGGVSHSPESQYYMVGTLVWCVVYYFICRGILLRRDW